MLLKSCFQRILVCLDEGNDSIDDKLFVGHCAFCQFQIPYIGGKRVLGTAANPCVNAVSEEMSAKDVLCFKEAARCIHLTFHHLVWISVIIHVMRFSRMSIVKHQCRPFLTSGTSHPLQEVAGFRRHVGIAHHVQVTYVYTHFKCRCGGQHIDGVGMGMLLEILLQLLPVSTFQQACMLSRIYTGRQVAVIDLLIIVQFRIDLLRIGSCTLVIQTKGVFRKVVILCDIKC